MIAIEANQRPRVPVVRGVHPAWRWVGWLFLFIAGLALAASFVELGPWGALELGFNFLAFASLAVTSLAVHLAIRIFHNQAVQAEADTSAQAHLLKIIREFSSTAAERAGSAADHAAEIIRFLSKAQESKTNLPLSPKRETEALNAYNLATKEVRQVLWVDDNSDFIDLERKTLEAAGVGTVWVSSTIRALEVLCGNSFGVVITDMARAEGEREGYVLLDAMRNRGDQTPLIVYSGSRRPDHVAQVLDHGGQGATNDPAELFGLVMKEFT